MLVPSQILDGYHLIRPIGRGGFGEVWLSRLEATGELRALKFLPASDPEQLERELAALIQYRSVALELQCPNLLSIEHVNRTESGLFYTMPLADGTTVDAEKDISWQPWTLAVLIAHRKSQSMWFSAEEIREIIVPLINAVQQLSDAGVVHRDIKPENILFIGGRPSLGDVSLLTADCETLTRRGTPGYVAPSWYLESGGNPDMWGLATTLYSLITGNPPDKVGRAAFLWPPQGEVSVDQDAWNRFHRIILRATSEQAVERYLRFDDFAAALSLQQNAEPTVSRARAGKRAKPAIYALGLVMLLIFGGIAWWSYHRGGSVASSPVVPNAAPLSTSAEFEAAMTSTGKEFEKLFADAQKNILRSSKNKPTIERFNGLLQKIKKADSVDQVDEILNEIDLTIPSILDELYVPSNERLNETVKQLDAVACRPTTLAKNADEEFRGGRVTDPLRDRVYKFQDQVGQIIGIHSQERANLSNLLNDVVVGAESRLNARQTNDGTSHWERIYKLCESIEKKLTRD